MECELAKECRDQGGCHPGSDDVVTIRQQWELIKRSIEWETGKGGREKEMAKLDEMWEILRKQGKVPKEDNRERLWPWLQKAWEEACKKLDDHKREEGDIKGLMKKRTWEKIRGELEEQCRLLGRMRSGGVMQQVHLNKNTATDHNKSTAEQRQTEKLSMPPTAPPLHVREDSDIYPDLANVLQHPPPYQNMPIQAPLLRVREGMIRTETMDDEAQINFNRFIQNELRREVEKLDKKIQDRFNASKLGLTGGSRNEGGGPSTSTPYRAPHTQTGDKTSPSSPILTPTTRIQRTVSTLTDPSPPGNQTLPLFRLDDSSEWTDEVSDNEQGAASQQPPLPSSAPSSSNYHYNPFAELLVRQETHDQRNPFDGGSTKIDKQEKKTQHKKDYHHQFPLLQKAEGQVYQPFPFSDATAILEKMPSPTQGGGPWMNQFCKLTTGTQLAMGDWRAIICKQIGSWEVHQVERQAGTHRHGDAVPFLPNATAIGLAMREHFPVPVGAMHHMTFKIKENEAIPAFLLECKAKWTDVTGSHPDVDRMQQELFRKAVMDGMPTDVQKPMKENPDMVGCDTSMWEKHLCHHYRQHQDKRSQVDSDIVESQNQLLKLQLAEARQKVNEIKKIKDKQIQMVQQSQAPVSTTPAYQPAPQWGPDTRSHYNTQGRGRGMSRGRGMGRGAFRPQPPSRQGCFVCGALDHWCRDCPCVHLPPGGWMGQASGWGPSAPLSGQGQAQRPLHQAPNQGAAPRGQYPMGEWLPSEEGQGQY